MRISDWSSDVCSSDLDNDIGELLGTRGREFGVNTGRKRRCGWFDAVLVRQSAAVSGITGIALTKLDILDGMDEIRSEEHTSELQSLMRISYAVFCLKKKK